MGNKKLIEVDLPLDEINYESAREKFIPHKHPCTLHRYWARRPLASCRAVIFASLVDDPSEYLKNETKAEEKREELHELIRHLVKWKNTNNEPLLEKARYEIACSVARSHGETAPTDADKVLKYLAEKSLPVYDLFCGGGSIPLEAQRLGLRARASDLNPVAVLINKAMIELPHQFRGKAPVNPDVDAFGQWRGTTGLASDIRYYGNWMREEAYKHIGDLYPKVELSDGEEVNVVAWLWARTVPCKSPACEFSMPLVHTYQLSKKNNNKHWTRPVVDRAAKTISFVVQDHKEGVPDTGSVKGKEVTCIACGEAATSEYVREQAKAGKMDVTMIAIVAEGARKKVFLSPQNEHVQKALCPEPKWKPTMRLPEDASNLSIQSYGITHWHQLFSNRQLTTLTTFSDLLSKEVRNRIIEDGATDAYADALCTYLALAVGRVAESSCMFARWQSGEAIAPIFSRQTIGMLWDFAEANLFSNSTQNWMHQIKWVADVIEALPTSANSGEVYQADAATTPYATDSPVVVTDPPYYDNIGYADLSDFFYVWLRPLLSDIYPELFISMSTPKADEMVANAHRFEDSQFRFERLFREMLQRIRERCSPDYPTSIFYAYKQQEEKRDGRASTGWETMLTGLISTGFQIVGTWPIRTEHKARPGAQKANALASSIVLVCRPRSDTAQSISYGRFINELGNEMPAALDRLTREAHIAPVDLAQASIGPGMEVYSRYKSIKKRQDGALVDVPVREALVAINNEIDKYLETQEGEFDSYTRFCLRWFMQHGFDEGTYGDADTLAKAINVGVESMKGRLLTAEENVVKLLQPNDYDSTHPNAELSLLDITTWEACHLMIFHLNPDNEDGQEVSGAADVARRMRVNPALNSRVESVERLAWILFNYYDRRDDSWNAMLCNNLVNAWQAIERKMREGQQENFF